jgi:hypothetical protein
MAALFNFAPAFPAITSVTEGITATPGGTQAAGVQLVSRYNRISVCATAADSVVLPPWLADQAIYVSNDGAAALAVFPYTGQSINAAAVNAVFSIPVAKSATFTGSGTSGKWFVNLSA